MCSRIDRIFPCKAENHARARTIMTGIMRMTADLKLSFITEDVEIEARYRALKDIFRRQYEAISVFVPE